MERARTTQLAKDFSAAYILSFPNCNQIQTPAEAHMAGINKMLLRPECSDNIV